MAKFNTSNTNSNEMTTNHEGFTAYKLNDEESLLTMVFTSFYNEDKFYGDNTEELINLAEKLIKKGKAEYVSKLAIFARREMNLRSVSHALCALLAHEDKGKPYARNTIKMVCLRADDITEILSFYIDVYQSPIPNSLKKGLADAMNLFNEYQFGKYKGNDKAITFKKVLKTSHPHPKDEKQSQLFYKIINNELEIPYTWETELSTKGNTKEVWEELIASGKVGIMALVRNLNNILNAQVNNLDKVLETIENETIIKESKMLPFRFFSAYQIIRTNPYCTSKVLSSLEKAIKTSTNNIQKLKGKTMIAIDTSASMGIRISRNSMVTCLNIGTLLGSLANYICEDALVMTFSSHLKVQNLPTNNGIISNALAIKTENAGTDLVLPMLYLIKKKIFVDRIIYISDNEINYEFNHVENLLSKYIPKKYDTDCQKLLNEYKLEINPNVIFHGVDLMGYGTKQFQGKNVYVFAGWNEQIFNFINLIEQGVDSLVSIVKNYKI